jgi:purine-binding chemotaxis protein CheW
MSNDNNKATSEQITEYVTVMICGQLFGVLNLRGRIVTAIDMRRRLGLPPRTDDKPSMAVGIELKGESYGLLIDTVGEVMKLGDATRESNPVNLDSRLARVSGGVHRLDGQLMVILDVDHVLNNNTESMAA